MRVLTLRGPNAARVLDKYSELLTTLREYVPDLILIGGAVRDVYFERTVKDLDFMTCDEQAPRALSEFYGEPILPCDRGDKDVGEYEGAGSSLIAAYENLTKRINVLQVCGIDAHIARFPDSISKIWTDGGNVYATPDFNETATSRVVKYNIRMTDERLGRIQSKYADFAYYYDDGDLV